MRVKVRGGSGGRKLGYAWSVYWGGPGSITANQSDALNTLNTTLKALNANKRRYSVKKDTLFVGTTLIFKLVATNFLGQSTEETLSVLRENKNLPQVVLSAKIITRKVSQKIRIRGRYCILQYLQ